ncbi:MAG: EamA family transporter [Pseudomonadota bacterium]
MAHDERIQAILLTAIAPIVWGSTYIVTTELLPANSPLFASAIRALPAGLLLIAYTRSLPSRHWWGKLACLGALNIGLFFYCLFFAASYLPGGTAALVMSSQPIIVMLLSGLVLKTRIDLTHCIAAIFGLAGVALIVINETVQLSVQGIILALMGTLSMATGVVLTKYWGRPKHMSTLAFTGWQLLVGGVILLPAALWFEGLPETVSLKNIAGYSYLTLIGAVVAYALWFKGIERLPATNVAFLGFLSSVSACVLGFVFLDETLTPMQLLGAGAILISIFFASATQNSTKQHPLTTD